jgi:hypothetical protein
MVPRDDPTEDGMDQRPLDGKALHARWAEPCPDTDERRAAQEVISILLGPLRGSGPEPQKRG